MRPMSGEVSSDDKLLAALSYWGTFFSFIPALVIFLIKKDQSAFVKRHAMLAIVYNLAGIAAWVLLTIVSVILGIVSFGILGWLMSFAMLVLMFGFVVYALVLGFKVFQGEDVDIPMLSDLVAKNLSA